MAARLWQGVPHVFVEVPWFHGRLHHLLAVGGVCIALLRRKRRDVVLVFFMVLSTLPFVWTAVSNPAARVAYGGWFPFSIYFVALSFDMALTLASKIGYIRVSQRA